MKQRSCVILAGSNAASKIRAEGLRPEQFSTLVGASGGPKWLAISHLDRVLISDFFCRPSGPIVTLGSSIGSFRNMCYAMKDAMGALERLEYGYIHQRYSSARPSSVEVAAVGERVLLEVLGATGAREIVENTLWQSHFVTVRGRGPLSSERPALLAPALLLSALANAVSRRSLGAFWSRVVFHAGTAPAIRLCNLPTVYTQLSESNVRTSVLASGSIPLMMRGVSTPQGAPQGNYRDGGITDYHFDLNFEHPPGLALYPHFFPYIVPGWFDKRLSWRWVRGGAMCNTLLVAPSPGWVAKLPFGKISDRNDLLCLPHQQRVRYWQAVVEAGKQVAEDFYELWQTGAIIDALIEVGSDQAPHKVVRAFAA